MKTWEADVTGLAGGGALGPMLCGTGPCIAAAMGTLWPATGPRASIALGSRPEEGNKSHLTVDWIRSFYSYVWGHPWWKSLHQLYSCYTGTGWLFLFQRSIFISILILVVWLVWNGTFSNQSVLQNVWIKTASSLPSLPGTSHIGPNPCSLLKHKRVQRPFDWVPSLAACSRFNDRGVKLTKPLDLIVSSCATRHICHIRWIIYESIGLSYNSSINIRKERQLHC